MKKLILPLLVLGLASMSYAGSSCGTGGCDKPQAPDTKEKCAEKCPDGASKCDKAEKK